MTITKKSYFLVLYFFNMQQYLYQSTGSSDMPDKSVQIGKNYNASERFNTFNAKQSRLDMEKQ